MVKPEADEEYTTSSSSFDPSFTAALQAIEELCGKLPNVAVAYLPKRGICVFLDDSQGHNPHAGEFFAHRVAQNILHAVAERCDIRLRIGIGGAKSDWRRLSESHREASLAIASTSERIATYRKPTAPSKSFPPPPIRSAAWRARIEWLET